MKLGKTSWLILGIGIFVISFAGLGVIRSQQLDKQVRLGQELSLVEMRLDKFQLEQLHSQQNELEEQISQSISQLEAARAALRQPIESIEVTDVLFEIAESCGVEITGVTSPGIASEELEGISCPVIRLNIEVEGDVPNLLSFVIKLNDDFATGVVESVGIGVQGSVEEEIEGEQIGEETEEEQAEEEIGAEGIEGEAEKSSADIKLIVYSYQGG